MLKTSKEKKLFELIRDSEELSGIGVHLTDTDEGEKIFRVYIADGYCFDINQTYIADEKYLEDYQIQDLHEDGNTYDYTCDFDGFRDLAINGALEYFTPSLDIQDDINECNIEFKYDVEGNLDIATNTSDATHYLEIPKEDIPKLIEFLQNNK